MKSFHLISSLNHALVAAAWRWLRFLVALGLLAIVGLSGTAHAALVCAANDPGSIFTASGVVNSYYPGTGTASGTTITVGALDTSGGGAATPIAAGDMILIMQMQDASINSTNSTNYGAGTGSSSGVTALNNAGRFEYAIVSTFVGSTITTTAALSTTYQSSAASATKGQSTFQVVRVPRFPSVTATNVLAGYWNGKTGGLVALDVAGSFSGSVDVSGRGFRGGGARALNGDAAAANTDVVSPFAVNAHGGKAEGIAGTPELVFNAANSLVVDTGLDGYPNGSDANGAPGNAGGGGTDGNPSVNDQNSGGGGGANGGSGGRGGNAWNSALVIGGFGGSSLVPSSTRVYMGGGGGAGSRNNSVDPQSSGGAGGGIILIRAGSFSSGTLNADGAVGSTPANDGGGGGGAGGTILITGTSGSVTASAKGAVGTNAFSTATTLADQHGPGGGGGGGAVLKSAGITATSTLTGGANGTTTTLATNFGATAGSSGTSVTITDAAIAGASSGNACAPVLTVTKSTVPTGPVVANPGNTVTYRITIANAAAVETASKVAVSDVLPGAPSPFTNASAAPTIVLAGGATRPTTTNAAVGATTPSWDSFTIPAGGSVQLDFNATVPIGTTLAVYQNTGKATYQDPRRTVAAGTTSTSSNSASTNEDVNVVAAPVIAKGFSPTIVEPNKPSVLTLTLTNSNTFAITGATFTDTYPAGLVNTLTPAGATNCSGGTVVAANGGSSVALSGATLPASSSCTVTVNVTATSVGSYVNTLPVGAFTTTNSGSNTAATSATLSVVNAPTVAKAFNPNPGFAGSSSVLTITLSNNNAAAATGATFTDTYPTGLTNTSAAGGATTCVGGTVTAANNASSVALAGGAIPPNGSCTVTVNVVAAVAGLYTNSIPAGSITTTNAGSNSTAASATYTVLAALTASKAFVQPTIPVNGTSVLTITLNNPNATAVTGVSFTDTYPSGLVNTSSAGAATSCGAGSVSATNGGTSVALSNGTIPANGSCTVTVNVTSTTAATYVNTTGAITTGNAGSASPASGTLTVLAPPTVAKAFSVNPGFIGGTSILTITLSNSNATAITGAAFTDTYPANLTNTAAPSGATTCASGVVTAASNSGSVALSGGTIPANGSCTVTVNVASSTAGTFTNTIPVGGVSTTNANSNTAAASATYTVLAPLGVTKVFSPSAIAVNGTSVMTITLTNPSANASAINAIAFNDSYPSGLVNTNSANAVTSCTGGSVAAANNGSTLALSGAAIAANSSCTVTVNVTSASAGSYTNSTGPVTTGNAGSSSAASGTLTVLVPPSITKSFSPASVATGGTSVLTLTLSNTNAVALTGAAVTDNYPSGLTNTGTPSGATTCSGGAVAAASNGTSVALTGGQIPANGSCTVTVNVTSVAGTFTNTVPAGALTTTNGGANVIAASATFSTLAPTTISKAFTPSIIGTSGVSTMTFTINNPSVSVLSGLAFTDTYPAGLVNASPSNVTNTCGGAVIGGTFGGNTFGLSGGTVSAGSSCKMTVDVTAATSGNYVNTTSTVSSTNAGTGNTASATLTVLTKPTVTKAFSPTSIPANGTSTLTLTVSNSNAIALSNVGLSDSFPAGLMVAATPAATTTCGGAITGSIAGSSVLGLTGGSIGANASCTLSVSVTSTASGSFTNTSGGASSTQTGSAGPNSNSATLVVAVPPSITKSFGPNPVNTSAPSTLTLTIFNSNTVALTGLAFTDTYPVGLLNSASPSTTNTCAGATTGGTAGGNSIGLSGGTVAANSTCTVTVQVFSATNGNYTNVTGAVSATNGGTGNTASATLSVAANPTIVKSFSPAAIANNGVSTLTLTVSNNSALPLSGVAFNDTFPSGLVIAASPTLTNTCAGTITGGAAGNGSVNLSGGILGGNASCSITVKVTAAAGGSYSNTTGNVSSTQTGNAAPSNTAVLQVYTSASIAKSFSPSNILANANSTLSLTITNPDSIALTGLAFTDNFPAGLKISALPTATNTCGGALNNATAGSSSFSLSGGNLNPSSSCTITVQVTSSTPGSLTNTTTGVTSNEAGTGAGSNASILVISAPDLQLTKTHSGNFTVGSNASYTLVADNKAGTGATSGTITVTDTLPSGLTYVASGSGGMGWTCTVSGQIVTCTTNDVINFGASGNPITVNVSVADVAVPSVTNKASVAGGGELPANAGNNSAADFTIVNGTQQNAFLTDGQQAGLPGAAVFYSHIFKAGIAGSVVFSTSDIAIPSNAAWNTLIYRDTNCNGQLDGTEGNAPLTGSIAVVPGDQICLIVKSFIPANAAYGARDQISVTATFTPTAPGAPVSSVRTDLTTVGSSGGSGLVLQKSVRNVTTGGPFGTNNVGKTGDVLEYMISYTNNDSGVLNAITIDDFTPNYTVFVSASCTAPLPASITSCSVSTQPAAAASGAIVWTLGGVLQSGATGSVLFSVTIQ